LSGFGWDIKIIIIVVTCVVVKIHYYRRSRLVCGRRPEKWVSFLGNFMEFLLCESLEILKKKHTKTEMTGVEF
jgi:hypothetical protein